MASSSSSYYHRSAAVHQPPYLASTAASPVINHPSFGAAPHNGNNNNNNNGDGDQNDTGPDGSSNNNPNTPLPGRDVILPSSSSSSFPYHSEYLALIQTFHTAYQHAASPETKRMLAQQVWDVMVTDHRARFFCRPPPDDNHHNDSSSVGPARPLTREQALPHIGKALEEWRRDQSGPEEPNGTGPSFSSSSSPRKTKRSRPNPNNNGSSNIFNNHSSSSSHPPPAAAATAAAFHHHIVGFPTVFRLFFQSLHRLDFGNVMHQHILHALFQRHGRRWASHTTPRQLNRDQSTFLIKPNISNIPTILLNGRSNSRFHEFLNHGHNFVVIVQNGRVGNFRLVE
mmetsp:Transcript_14940/g.33943  ORF Transcript_14940/g.33943 Transcript_14940/m.33943 type:complete len:341 (+) Transcript_14940:154-1176(+)